MDNSCKFEAFCYYMLTLNEQGQFSWDENAGLALRVLFDPMSAWVWVIRVCSRIAPGLLQDRSGMLPDRSLIAPGTHRPAPGTIRAAQGAKSGVKSGRKRKGKVSRLPQKCSTKDCKCTTVVVAATIEAEGKSDWSWDDISEAGLCQILCQSILSELPVEDCIALLLSIISSTRKVMNNCRQAMSLPWP